MGNKKMKKFLCHGISLAMVCSTLAGNINVAQSMAPAKAVTSEQQEETKKVLYRNGFEDGEYMGITGRGEVSLEVSTSEHYGVGNNSLSCSGRKETWNGIQLPLSSYVTTGNTYDFSAYVKQNTGEDVNISMLLQYTDANGKPQYVPVDETLPQGKTCKSGEWVQVSGSCEIAENEGDIALCIECPESKTASFLVDELTISGIPTSDDEFVPNVQLYRSMVEGGVFSTGNNARLKETIKKAREGKDVSLAYIGGSITEGGGYNPNSACYAEVSATAFAQKYGVNGGENVHFINAGMSGTPSDIGIVRYDRDVIKRLPEGSDHPDVLFIEFAVNDSGCATKGGAYEGLIRQALKSGSAVVLIFSVFNNLNRVCEMDYRKYGNNYDLPMISTADAIQNVYKETGFYDWFYNDTLHPNRNGYKLMADCILELMDKVDKEEAEADNITDVDSMKAVTSAAYEGMKMIDSSTTAASDNAIGAIQVGGFGSKDTGLPRFQYVYNGEANAPWFPNNWMHTKNDSTDTLTIDINCQTFMLVYKESSESTYGSADLYVDGVKKSTLKCYNKSGWNNGKVCIALKEDKSSMHRIELKMAEGDEAKKFTLYAIGYKTDGKDATEYVPTVTPTPTPTQTPTVTPEPTAAPTAVPTAMPTVSPNSQQNTPNQTVVKKVTAPGKVAIKSAKAKGKKATIKWAKVKEAAGYQVQYSTSKKFKNSKTVSTKKTSVTLKKLKKKTYYVKVKAYKLDGKKKVYGKWSKVKRFKA